jgi:hypothetical protein
MAKLTFSRTDVEALALRLQERGGSTLMDDMPSTQRDMKSAAALLAWFVERGMPLRPVVLDINNGTI